MSDGNISQEEIDQLLNGSSDDLMSGLSSAPKTPTAGGGATLSSSETEVLTELFNEISEAQSGNLTGIMVTNVKLKDLKVECSTREAFLSTLSDEVVEVKADYTDGFMASHLYVFTPDLALQVAELMIGQVDLELDATAVSSLSEAVSQMTGSAATQMGDRISRNLMIDAPSGNSEPKAMLNLPPEPFVKLTYSMEIEGKATFDLYEIYEMPMIKELAGLLGATSAPDSSAMNMNPMDQQQMGGQQMGNQQMGNQQMGNQQMGGQQMGGLQMGGYQQPMGGYQQPQMGMMGGGVAMPNVQSVQYPDFSQNLSPNQQRNISLLMDVSMEMTVELGRTKWLIKDILGMGEGTIIELDKLAGEPVDILVNNNPIARGEVVVIDENFGVRVTEIISSAVESITD
ncbi:MAG: flagellar motor switch phosphatase FliY [Spirochaetaceae bacterium]|jgi:flagellar motor switch protein FliN/FliY|nr:flagellar motor switch phosphatase FliY [Spirochaetaceae bacterium]